jgi:intein/homing endonuclease
MYNQSYNDVKRNVIYPENSEKLAELVGIIFGDGSMNIYKNSNKVEAILAVSGHSTDDNEYLVDYVSELIKNLFGITPTTKFKKGQNTMYLRIGSKGIVNFLMSKGVKLSPKENLKIPNWIIENKLYMVSFLRGLIDTDGSLAIKRKGRKYPYYPTIKITSKCKPFIEFLSIYLNKEGFSHYSFFDVDSKRYNQTFKISGMEFNGYSKLIYWMDNIGFHNPKHLNKIDIVEQQRKTLKRGC